MTDNRKDALPLNNTNQKTLSVLACPAFKTKAANPYTALLYEAMQQKGIKVEEFHPCRLLFASYDFLHFHWPEHHFLGDSTWRTLLKALRFFSVILVARAKGMRIVWTAHNLQSHSRLQPGLEKTCRRLFYRNLAGIISLNYATRDELMHNFPEGLSPPVAVIPHGHYRGFYPDTVSKLEARRHLGITDDKKLIFGWVGLIKPYKGLPELVAAWRDRPGADAALLIAGLVCDPQLNQLLEKAAAQDKRMIFCPGWVSIDQMQYFLKAADVVVLPFRAITNSGSALLALSFNVPVALPRTASMEELQAAVGKEWVYLYEGPFSPSVLNDIRCWVEKEPRHALAPLEFLNWDRLASQTVAFFDLLRRSSSDA